MFPWSSRLCVWLATLWAGSACSSAGSGANTGDAEPVRPEVLASTPYSGLAESARVVVRSAADWAPYPDLLAGGSGAATAPVDFERDMVIVVALGRRPTGGYGIEVDSVVARDAYLLVAVTETAPGSTCMTTQAFTAPAAAVRISRFQGSVRFAETKRTRECN